MIDLCRQGLRLTLFIGLLGAIALLALALKIADLAVRRPIDSAPWAQRCFRGATWSLGLKITCHGEPSPGPTLFVCNHVSWCDIPVLGGILPMTFLSKSEVGQWPLIGWLARQVGTLFIKRGRGKASGIVDQVANLLDSGQSVMIFPEGTTSPGMTVLPFHGRLLRAANIAEVPIQPISIVYRRGKQPDHLAPFINDDGFARHLGRLLGKSPPTVDVLLHPTVAVSAEEPLSSLAGTLQASVLDGVNALQNGAFDHVSQADNRQPLRRQSPRVFR
jgi:1-acyl-sn-glycerol-3-phosphate acyltransferase